MYNKLVIAIDQSYTKSGISIALDGKLKKVTSISFRGCRNKSEKRKQLANIINQIISSNQLKATSTLILCERIRTFSHNHDENQNDKQAKQKKNQQPQMFISTDYIKATGALIATIVDVAYEHGLQVYSVDTRSWKSQILGAGNTRKGKGQKEDAITYVSKLGFDLSSVNKKGKTIYDDDAADSACIALYGFLPESRQKLKLEE